MTRFLAEPGVIGHVQRFFPDRILNQAVSPGQEPVGRRAGEAGKRVSTPSCLPAHPSRSSLYYRAQRPCRKMTLFSAPAFPPGSSGRVFNDGEGCSPIPFAPSGRFRVVQHELRTSAFGLAVQPMPHMPSTATTMLFCICALTTTPILSDFCGHIPRPTALSVSNTV